MLLWENGQLRAYDALCPHRGANLTLGGKLENGKLTCPFHGLRIGLGRQEGQKLCVEGYETLVLGGLVFIRKGEEMDAGFSTFFEELEGSNYIVPGFALQVRAPAPLVIENAFDNMHFRTVHRIGNEPRFDIQPSEWGEYGVKSEFAIPPSPWQRSAQASPSEILHVPYHAWAFSPGIVVSRMGGTDPYHVITTSHPLPKGYTQLRLSVAVPPAADGSAPSMDLCRYLLDQSRKGLEMDQLIWESMDHGYPANFVEGDHSVLAFRKFCEGFA